MAASKRDSIDAKRTEDVVECADASCHDPVVGRSQFCKRHRDKQYKERHRKRKKTQAEGKGESDVADMQEAKRKLAEKVHGSSSSSSDPSYKDMLYPILAEKRQKLLDSMNVTEFLKRKQDELKRGTLVDPTESSGASAGHNLSGSSNDTLETEESDPVDTSTSLSSGNEASLNASTGGVGIGDEHNSSDSRTLSGYQASGSSEITSSGTSDTCHVRARSIDRETCARTRERIEKT